MSPDPQLSIPGFHLGGGGICLPFRVSFRNFHKGGQNWISKYLGNTMCKGLLYFPIMVMYRFEFLGHLR